MDCPPHRQSSGCASKVLYCSALRNHSVYHVRLAAFSFLFVSFLQAADFLSSPSMGLNVSQEPFGNEFRRCTEKAVAYSYVVVEKGQRFSGLQRLQP